MNESKAKIAISLICVVLVLSILTAVFKGGKETTSTGPILISESGHLYKISGKVFFRRCSVDGLDHFDPTEIDAKSFKPVNDLYVKDKNAVWKTGIPQYCDFPELLTLNPKVDSTTFSALEKDSTLSKDKISLIFKGQRLSQPSTNTTVLGQGYYKDKDQIWMNVGSKLVLLKGVPGNVRLLSRVYLADDKNVYATGYAWTETDSVQTVEGADPTTFKQLGTSNYAIDKNHVYASSKIFPIADPLTFAKIPGQSEMDEHCGYSYWKDSKNVYLKGKPIELADPATFKIFKYIGPPCNAGSYALDKNHVFYNGEILNEADASTAVYKGYISLADSKNIFFDGQKCLTADTLIKDSVSGYRVKVPKGWMYTSRPGNYSYGRIFDCVGISSGSYLSITKDDVNLGYWNVPEGELKVSSQFIPGAIIRGWKYYPEGDSSDNYVYEINFPKEKASFVIFTAKLIEEFGFLSTFAPDAGI